MLCNFSLHMHSSPVCTDMLPLSSVLLILRVLLHSPAASAPSTHLIVFVFREWWWNTSCLWLSATTRWQFWIQFYSILFVIRYYNLIDSIIHIVWFFLDESKEMSNPRKGTNTMRKDFIYICLAEQRDYWVRLSKRGRKITFQKHVCFIDRCISEKCKVFTQVIKMKIVLQENLDSILYILVL